MEDTRLRLELEISKVGNNLRVINRCPVAPGKLELNTSRRFASNRAFSRMTLDHDIVESENGINGFIAREKFAQLDIVEIVQGFSGSNKP
jgi:hypothetical protein